jgi:hypothetical protein
MEKCQLRRDQVEKYVNGCIWIIETQKIFNGWWYNNGKEKDTQV